MKIILLLAMTALFSCHSNTSNEVDHTHKAADTMAMKRSEAEKHLFAGVQFDNKYDLSCGMPLTAGLSDSAHYKGKVYGFCSPECKADFEKNADSLLLKAK